MIIYAYEIETGAPVTYSHGKSTTVVTGRLQAAKRMSPSEILKLAIEMSNGFIPQNSTLKNYKRIRNHMFTNTEFQRTITNS